MLTLGQNPKVCIYLGSPPNLFDLVKKKTNQNKKFWLSAKWKVLRLSIPALIIAETVTHNYEENFIDYFIILFFNR